jgi:ABC-2 type transport system permease protein/lipopolysaccharide transport system permease protein
VGYPCTGRDCEPGGSELTDAVVDISGGDDGLIIIDPASIPSNPAPESFYHHKVSVVSAIVEMTRRSEIMLALSERDIRSAYKQQVLGMAWAVVNPLIQVVLFTLIFSHVKAFKAPAGVPYIVSTFLGIMVWSYFAGSFSNGGGAMIANINLLQKTHFPRECFPLSQMLEQCLYTGVMLLPLTIILFITGFTPHVQVLWCPIFIVIELLFTGGMVLAMSSLIVYVRDLTQIMGLILQLGLFATPIIWPLSKLAKVTVGPFHHFDFRPYYVFVNPLGAVIDNLRRTALQGLSPEWGLLGIAAVSATLYFFLGYWIFKRIETGFADIT